jgi:hypothetical protein
MVRERGKNPAKPSSFLSLKLKVIFCPIYSLYMKTQKTNGKNYTDFVICYFFEK